MKRSCDEGRTTIAPLEAALEIARFLDEKKTDDIVVLKCDETFKIADYLIVATGASSRHVKTVARDLYDALKRTGLRAFHRAGEDDGRWAVIDFGAVIAHIFTRDARDFYRLENMWSDSPKIDWNKNAGKTD